MRRRLTMHSLITVVALGLWGCADRSTADNWPTITVTGAIMDFQNQPASGVLLTIRTFAPNGCGTSSIEQRFDVRANGSGIYNAKLTTPTSTYSACIRVTVGNTSRDTTVVNLPAFNSVQSFFSAPRLKRDSLGGPESSDVTSCHALGVLV